MKERKIDLKQYFDYLNSKDITFYSYVYNEYGFDNVYEEDKSPEK